MMHSLAKAAALLCGILLFSPTGAFAGKAWEGEIPAAAKDQTIWTALIPAMMENDLGYGALAAANRVLNFFGDLPSKELAYKTLIDVVDRGYPYDVSPMYVPGDIEPAKGYDFTNSYFLYKGILNLGEGFERWANYYFKRVDQEKFPKYLFYKAVKAYEAKELEEAKRILDSILKLEYPPERLSFVSKAARMLARIHFEKQDYTASLEVYDTFLLRLNPVTHTDWLEAAWNLYYLRRFDEALGYVYNLESKIAGDSVDVEKFILRALVYKELCASSQIEALVKSFRARFGKAIDGIMGGELLETYAVLDSLDIPENATYYRFSRTIKNLQREAAKVDTLPRSMRKVAAYLYESEIKMLKTSAALYREKAHLASSDYLINLHESLRFLSFDVAREKFNPDVVFAAPPEESQELVTKIDDRRFRLAWIQFDDFWRDERMKYLVRIKSKCSQ